MASVNINLTRWLSKISVDTKEMLESIIRKALTRSCVRVVKYARTHHRSWEERSGALAKAITYRFIHRLVAEVYVSDELLRKERAEADKRALDPKAKYKEGQDVGKGSWFPLNPYRNYGNYLSTAPVKPLPLGMGI